MATQRRVYTEVGKRIAGLARNQAELGRVLGVAQQTVSKKLRGAGAVSLSDLETLARHYGVPLGYFFEGGEVSPDLAAAWRRICGGTAECRELVSLVSRLPEAEARRLLEIARLLTCAPSEVAHAAAEPECPRARRGGPRRKRAVCPLAGLRDGC